MCDTILAPPSSTGAKIMLFGKNSDRQRNEAQTIEYFPGASHTEAELACTYIAVPQVRQTHAVLLCRPFWTWGAEMGANEYGVVVGNEGIHARRPAPQQAALIGMDLVRLALERATTAAQAVEVVTELLREHGQGGNCGHLAPSYYNNGFMIADAEEAYVLETVDREWLVERVQGVRAMSNTYSIQRNVQRVSEGLLALIGDAEWALEDAPDYAAVIANPTREHIGNAGARYAASTKLLRSREGQLTAADMMATLRDHGFGEGFHPRWQEECRVNRTLCMHAGAEERAAQTVGSMVCELHRGRPVHWVTGTAAPCISVFKPVLLDVPLPSLGPSPTDRFDARTLWWRHELLHRAALVGNFAGFLDELAAERDQLEASFRSRIQSILYGTVQSERARVVAECWQEAIVMEERWAARIDSEAITPRTASDAAWAKMNQLAGFPCPDKPSVQVQRAR